MDRIVTTFFDDFVTERVTVDSWLRACHFQYQYSEFIREVERLDYKIDCVNFTWLYNDCFISFDLLFATRAPAVRILANKFFLRWNKSHHICLPWQSVWFRLFGMHGDHSVRCWQFSLAFVDLRNVLDIFRFKRRTKELKSNLYPCVEWTIWFAMSGRWPGSIHVIPVGERI